MKKLICLILALAVCTVLFAGCGKFDMDNEDLTAYVKLGDITEFTYEEVCRQYEEYREQLAESTTAFSPASGYTLDFLVKAELVGEDDSLTEIEKWTHNSDNDYVEAYDVYRYSDYSAFDYALCYKVSDASDSTTTARSVEIGKEFSFTMELDEDYEDETLAGKTVKFTINVKKALPAIYADIFGTTPDGGYGTTTWTWNTEAEDGCWGNGGFLSNTGPGWWVIRSGEIDGQVTGAGLPDDGLNGWFSLSLSGVQTSRGESGSVKVSEDMVQSGWDVGTIEFSGTIPLLGIQPNQGNARQYVYHILKITEDELRLCAPEPGVTSGGGTAWFWNFKRK